MDIKIEGLDKLNRRLNELSRKARELGRTHDAKLVQLLTPTFMARYTKHSTLEGFLSAVGVKSEAEYKALPHATMDAHVRKCTRFKSWRELLQTAENQYMATKLGS